MIKRDTRIKPRWRSGVFPLLLLMASVSIAADGHSHGSVSERIEELSAQIAVEPTEQLVHDRAELYRQHGDWELGAKDFKWLRDMESDHAELDFEEGRFMHQAGHHERAAELLLRYLESNPRYAPAMIFLADARRALGQHEEAATWQVKAIEQTENPNPELYWRAALDWAHAEQPGGDRGRAAIAKGLERFPDSIVLLGAMLDWRLAEGNATEAREFLSRVPRGLLRAPSWKIRQAIVDCVDGNSKEAKAALSALIEQIDSAPRGRSEYWKQIRSEAESLQQERKLGKKQCQAHVSSGILHQSGAQG